RRGACRGCEEEGCATSAIAGNQGARHLLGQANSRGRQDGAAGSTFSSRSTEDGQSSIQLDTDQRSFRTLASFISDLGRAYCGSVFNWWSALVRKCLFTSSVIQCARDQQVDRPASHRSSSE